MLDPIMPLVCDELAPETVAALNRKIAACAPDHPLRKESEDSDLYVWTEGDCTVAIYKSKAGFYFSRISHNLESTLMAEIRGKREYLCTMFVVDEPEDAVAGTGGTPLSGEAAVKKLLEHFQEKHGVKLFSQMDYFDFHHRGARLLLVKLPSSVLRHMLAPTGGFLSTTFSGPLDSLQTIPTLVRVVTEMPERDGQRAVIVTKYTEGLHDKAMRLHWDIVREIIARPNSGITIGPIALWDS